jgi:probable F420-dependent oxidoreductase
VKFNYQFPLKAIKRWDEWSEGHQLADIAVAAEAAGFDVVSSTDHPYPDATWLKNGGHQDFELFTTLAFMAAKTTRIRLLTYVMIAGYRNPYLAARAAATLDYMSDGRLTMGMGAGYLKEEFEVLGASFDDRGKRFDATIAAMRNAWKGEVSDYDDPYYPAHNAIMTPTPKQKPGPPIWIGGNSKAALRRVAEHAQGWLPFEQLPETAKVTRTPALSSLEELADMIGQLTQLRAERGTTEPLDVCFAPLGVQDIDGHVDHIAQRLPDFEKAGVTYISYDGRARSWSDCMREIGLMGDLIAKSSTD